MSSLFGDFDPFYIFACIFVLFTAFPVHEFAHAATAVRLGDNTPIRQGRYTLNPFAHLSPVGSVALLLFGFGWAKPVQINIGNFRNPRRDAAIVSLMGPLSNILIALLALILQKVLIGVSSSDYRSFSMQLMLQFLSIVININLLLAAFNLLPIPPLDGSKLLSAFLPYRAYLFLAKHEGFVTVLLLLLLYTGYLFVPLDFLRGAILRGLDWLTSPIDKLFGLAF